MEVLSDAVNRGDEAEHGRLELQLKELKVCAAQVKTKDTKAFALAEMNHQNRHFSCRQLGFLWFRDPA
jgi:hypothetical protein